MMNPRAFGAAIVIGAAGITMTIATASARPGQAAPVAAAPFKVHAIDPILEAGSPDGKWAIYRKEATPRTVWLRDLATGRDTELVTFEKPIWWTAWSLDGRKIAFSVGDSAVHVVSISDRADRVLPTKGQVLGWTSHDEILDSQPDHKPVQFVVLPAGGGDPKVVYVGGPQPGDRPMAITRTAES
jgi:hypothetical protein